MIKNRKLFLRTIALLTLAAFISTGLAQPCYASSFLRTPATGKTEVSRNIAGELAKDPDELIKIRLRQPLWTHIEHVWDEKERRYLAYEVVFLNDYDDKLNKGELTGKANAEDRKRAPEKDLTQKQSQILRDAVNKLNLPEGREPSFVTILDEAKVAPGNDIEHSTFVHAGHTRSRIWLGELLFNDFISKEEDPLRNRVFAHEAEHIKDKDFTDDHKDPGHKELLNDVARRCEELLESKDLGHLQLLLSVEFLHWMMSCLEQPLGEIAGYIAISEGEKNIAQEDKRIFDEAKAYIEDYVCKGKVFRKYFADNRDNAVCSAKLVPIALQRIDNFLSYYPEADKIVESLAKYLPGDDIECLKQMLAQAKDEARTIKGGLSMISTQNRGSYVDVNASIKSVAGMVTVMAAHKYFNLAKPEYGFEFEGSLPCVAGVGAPLAAAWLSLLVNASRAYNLPAGKESRVVIKTSLEEEPSSGKEFIKVEFKDFASGISKDMLPRIFEKDSATKSEKTADLGLYSVKKIVESYGGAVEVESRHISEFPGNHGTTFTVRLPVTRESDNTSAGDIEQFRKDRETFFKNSYEYVKADPEILRLSAEEKIRRLRELPHLFKLTIKDMILLKTLIEYYRFKDSYKDVPEFEEDMKIILPHIIQIDESAAPDLSDEDKDTLLKSQRSLLSIEFLHRLGTQGCSLEKIANTIRILEVNKDIGQEDKKVFDEAKAYSEEYVYRVRALTHYFYADRDDPARSAKFVPIALQVIDEYLKYQPEIDGIITRLARYLPDDEVESLKHWVAHDVLEARIIKDNMDKLSVFSGVRNAADMAAPHKYFEPAKPQGIEKPGPEFTQKKQAFSFGKNEAEECSDPLDLLGNKGANLAEMARMGLPVPAGFTITTSVTLDYLERKNLPADFDNNLREWVRAIEDEMGKKFGDARNPLLLSVRSGAKFSMPGFLKTVTNVGLNDETVEALARQTNDRRFAYDTYARFLADYGTGVLGIEKKEFESVTEKLLQEKNYASRTDLSAADLEELVRRFKSRISKALKKGVPQEPYEQLSECVKAVMSSWLAPNAVKYRRRNEIPDDIGTAVNVQAMVFGNIGNNSATGVAFSRNPLNGEKEIFGEVAFRSQGKDTVGGKISPRNISELKERMPDVYSELNEYLGRLEERFSEIQEVEFTIENGRLYLLQTRGNLKRVSPLAKVRTFLEKYKGWGMYEEWCSSDRELISKVTLEELEMFKKALDSPLLNPKSKKKVLASGIPSSPGLASGRVVFDREEAIKLAKKGEEVIWVVTNFIGFTSEDEEAVKSVSGVLMKRGGATSHPANICRGLKEMKPLITGAEEIEIDNGRGLLKIGDVTIEKGEYITLDGIKGNVLEGKLAENDLVRDITPWGGTKRFIDDLEKVTTLKKMLQGADIKAAISIDESKRKGTPAPEGLPYISESEKFAAIEILARAKAILEKNPERWRSGFSDSQVARSLLTGRRLTLDAKIRVIRYLYAVDKKTLGRILSCSGLTHDDLIKVFQRFWESKDFELAKGLVEAMAFYDISELSDAEMRDFREYDVYSLARVLMAFPEELLPDVLSDTNTDALHNIIEQFASMYNLSESDQIWMAGRRAGDVWQGWEIWIKRAIKESIKGLGDSKSGEFTRALSKSAKEWLGVAAEPTGIKSEETTQPRVIEISSNEYPNLSELLAQRIVVAAGDASEALDLLEKEAKENPHLVWAILNGVDLTSNTTKRYIILERGDLEGIDIPEDTNRFKVGDVEFLIFDAKGKDVTAKEVIESFKLNDAESENISFMLTNDSKINPETYRAYVYEPQTLKDLIKQVIQNLIAPSPETMNLYKELKEQAEALEFV